MMPGPKIATQTAMESALDEILRGDDAWREERGRVRALVFDNPEGSAVDRLMALFDDVRQEQNPALCCCCGAESVLGAA